MKPCLRHGQGFQSVEDGRTAQECDDGTVKSDQPKLPRPAHLITLPHVFIDTNVLVEPMVPLKHASSSHGCQVHFFEGVHITVHVATVRHERSG